MKRSSSLLLVLSLFAGICAAQGVDPDWKAPEKDSARTNPLASRPQLAAGGEKLFARSCASCHGDEAKRAAAKAPDLASPAVQAETDGALFWKITNGNTRRSMPAWGVLPEPQRWQLVLYLRKLEKERDSTH